MVYLISINYKWLQSVDLAFVKAVLVVNKELFIVPRRNNIVCLRQKLKLLQIGSQNRSIKLLFDSNVCNIKKKMVCAQNFCNEVNFEEGGTTPKALKEAKLKFRFGQFKEFCYNSIKAENLYLNV